MVPRVATLGRRLRGLCSGAHAFWATGGARTAAPTALATLGLAVLLFGRVTTQSLAAQTGAQLSARGELLAPGTPGTPGTPGELEVALLVRVNADRQAHGLPPVTFDPELLEVARVRAAAQAGRIGLSHADRGVGTDSEGRTPTGVPTSPLSDARSAVTDTASVTRTPATLAFTRLLKEAGVSYYLAGENLARPSASPGIDPVEAAEQALMKSPTHRENILTPGFDRAAVGLARDARGQVIFAQIFRAG